MVKYKGKYSKKARKWYFACVMDVVNNVVCVVSSVFAKYVDRLNDDTPTVMNFMSAVKGIEIKRKKKKAERMQLKIPFPENIQYKKLIRLTEADLYRIVRESVSKVLRWLNKVNE